MSVFSSSPSIPAPEAVKPLPELPKGINVGQSLVRQNRERIRLASGVRPILNTIVTADMASKLPGLLGTNESLGGYPGQREVG